MQLGEVQILEKTAFVLSDKVKRINEVQRKALHISAVFVNNFVNHFFDSTKKHDGAFLHFRQPKLGSLANKTRKTRSKNLKIRTPELLANLVPKYDKHTK